MAEKKMTKKDRYNVLLGYEEVKADAEMVKFIQHEIELLEKKSSGEKKPSKAQAENQKLRIEIAKCMQAEPNRLFTIGEMIKVFPVCAEMTNQRVSALITGLKEDHIVERISEKRKAYFRIAKDVVLPEIAE